MKRRNWAADRTRRSIERTLRHVGNPVCHRLLLSRKPWVSQAARQEDLVILSRLIVNEFECYWKIHPLPQGRNGTVVISLHFATSITDKTFRDLSRPFTSSQDLLIPF